MAEGEAEEKSSKKKLKKRKTQARTLQYKDAVFRSYFKIKANVLALYKAVSNVENIFESDITMVDLDAVYDNGRRNDVAFTYGNQLIVLMEHQSTLNLNMPLRFLSYLSRYYDRITKNEGIYSHDLISLPSPRFYVFYNGSNNEVEEYRQLKLSDAFADDNCCVELVVDVYDIKYERNREILQKCQQIMWYSIFVSKVEKFTKIADTTEQAVRMAVDYCIEHDVMKAFMEQHRQEVVNMFTEEWDQEKAIRISRREGEEAGRAAGIKIGEEAGRAAGIKIGEETGRAAGVKEEKYETAKEMLKDKMSFEKIAQYTKLTIEEIKNIGARTAVL